MSSYDELSTDRFIDNPNFDTPNNPLTGTEQGPWSNGGKGEQNAARVQADARERARIVASGECFCNEPVMRWFVCPVHNKTVR